MRITAYGHPNILATHPTTLEVTTESFVTKKGDCIIGVKASHSVADIRDTLLPLKGSHIDITFSVQNITETVTGFLHPDLLFTNTISMVLRKSSFICPRTLVVHADKAAQDLSRTLVEKMRHHTQKMVIHITPHVNPGM
ncbi:MAG: DUF371 domain-containing protein [Candidatus Methanofastidiosia archaeon]|jgi:hypothetical protein